MFSGSSLSSNQLRNSLLSSDFAASRRIPPNLISCIVVHIEGLSTVDMNDLVMDEEQRAIWECVVLFGCKLIQRSM
jgi:hypothetical protein